MTLAKCKPARYDARMPYRTFDGQNCSIARALEVLGERWTLLVLREVLLGRRRFEEIRRNTGVATNILTDRLATLVEHDVLERATATSTCRRARRSTPTPCSSR